MTVAALILVAAACAGSSETSSTTAVSGSATTTTAAPPTSSAATTVPATAAPTTDPGAPSTTTTTDSGATTTTILAPTEPQPAPADLRLALREVAGGFEQPVFVTSPPGDGRLFVVDQSGLIHLLSDAGPTVSLDIRDRVVYSGEQGLLGLAFHPDFGANGRFYVNYVTDRGGRATRISEFRFGDDGAADPDSERVLLSIRQPAGNHNGGMIAFGPDGYLYVGMGDGGGANDTFGQGQDPTTLLGSMLRIDVAATDAGEYGVPEDNPFVDGGVPGNLAGALEIWAYGLRNPWRFAFDVPGNRLWIADVGQNEWEEINATVLTWNEPGFEPVRNYGWPITEGLECFRNSGCDQSELERPVLVYSHSDGCSITGGYVYRGSSIPELGGHYFYGDYCRGFVRSVAVDAAGNVIDARDWSGDLGAVPELTSFGTDAAGNLYVVSGRGTIWEIVRS